MTEFEIEKLKALVRVLKDSGNHGAAFYVNKAIEELSPKKAQFKVRDGVVEEGEDFWWLASDGHEKVTATTFCDHERNLKAYPEAYAKILPAMLKDSCGGYVYEGDVGFDTLLSSLGRIVKWNTSVEI